MNKNISGKREKETLRENSIFTGNDNLFPLQIYRSVGELKTEWIK